jgi:hypothetical protein
MIRSSEEEDGAARRRHRKNNASVEDALVDWKYPYHADGYLATMVAFVIRLPHLRELIFLEMPYVVTLPFHEFVDRPLEDECWHGEHEPLQQLRSISLHDWWSSAGNISPYLFALAPNVTAAKLMLYPPGEHRASRYAWDDHLTYWSRRNNPDGTLRTVYMSLIWGTGTNGEDAIYIIRSIASRFPEVEHLEIRTAGHLSPLGLDVDEGSMQVSVTPTDPDDCK